MYRNIHTKILFVIRLKLQWFVHIIDKNQKKKNYIQLHTNFRVLVITIKVLYSVFLIDSII